MRVSFLCWELLTWHPEKGTRILPAHARNIGLPLRYDSHGCGAAITAPTCCSGIKMVLRSKNSKRLARILAGAALLLLVLLPANQIKTSSFIVDTFDPAVELATAPQPRYSNWNGAATSFYTNRTRQNKTVPYTMVVKVSFQTRASSQNFIFFFLFFQIMYK